MSLSPTSPSPCANLVDGSHIRPTTPASGPDLGWCANFMPVVGKDKGSIPSL